MDIPKKSGGKHTLGMSTMGDRVCKMVVKLILGPQVKPHFLEALYGYRLNKLALDAIGITRQRCWKYDWVLEFNMKGLFNNIPHNLLMKAVCKHIKER